MTADPAHLLVIGADGALDAMAARLATTDLAVHRALSVAEATPVLSSLCPDAVVVGTDLPPTALSDPLADLRPKLSRGAGTPPVPVMLLLPAAAPADMALDDLLANAVADICHADMPPALLDARVRTLVELRRLRGSTASLFHADGCRGIADRAAFDSMLKRESARLRRSDGYLGLLLISLDGLRDCRRTLGSAAGEGLIQRLAACAAQQVRRPPDLVARFDADRIACLLPETDLRGARVVAELIRGAIRTMDVPWDDTRVTVSVGVASRRCSGPEAALWLLTDAEERLIRAQRGGGDRLHTGDESIVMPRVQTSRGPARARPNL